MPLAAGQGQNFGAGQFRELDGVAAPVEEVRRPTGQGAQVAPGHPEGHRLGNGPGPFGPAQVEAIQQAPSQIGMGQGPIQANHHDRPEWPVGGGLLHPVQDVVVFVLDLDSVQGHRGHGGGQVGDQLVPGGRGVADAKVQREAVASAQAAAQGPEGLSRLLGPGASGGNAQGSVAPG